MEISDQFFDLIPFSLKEKENLKEALDQEPSLSIRSNPKKNTGNFTSLEPVPWANHAYYLSKRPAFIEDPLLHAGTYYVQEASSMFIESAIKPFLKTKMKVLDLCASPGGKSTHLLSMISEDSILVSNEVIKSRANILAENILKWGQSNVVITQNEVSDFSVCKGLFDLILIDAPCSGEGMFRKSLVSRKEWNINLVNLCSARQKKILGEAVELLADDGILIYSTCTFNALEDENNVDWLVTHFELESLPIQINANHGISEVITAKSYCYKFIPGKVRGEGFFVSVLRKTTTGKAPRVKKNKFATKNIQKLAALPVAFELDKNCSVIKRKNGELSIIRSSYFEFIDQVTQQLNCIQIGIPIGENIHKKFKFHHGAAMSTDISFPELPREEIDLNKALKYLSKLDFALDSEHKGWVILTYQNTPIGFAKLLGNRINNYYPSYFRIRKDLKL